ncbi:MAG: glycosyl hydrolase family protein [Flavobacterium sp.]|nr:MAG: glycosyl hydrolase family protein [Flavobacterium sp.]
MKSNFLFWVGTACIYAIIACSAKLHQREPSLKASAQLSPSQFVPDGYDLAFSDEFNTGKLDITKWEYRLGEKFGGGYASVQIAANVTIKSGKLIVKGVFNDTRTGGRNSGGGIISKQHFKYGYYEARAKMQRTEWWHSAFWTFNNINASRKTEIDVFERDNAYDVDDGVLKIRQNIIQHSSGKAITLKGSVKHPLTFDPAKSFHIYGMLWNKDEVKFYVDGELTNTIPYAVSVYPQDENAIWLSMIGKNKTLANGECYFDYVRYYKETKK